MNKEIVVELQNTNDEIISACKNMFFSIPAIKYAPLGILAIVGLNLVAIAMGSNVVVEEKSTFETLLPFFLVPIIWGLIIFSAIRGTKRKVLANPKITEKQILTFTQDSFQQKGETYQIEYFWKDLYKIKETKKWFFIYINKASAIVLVKNKLTDNQYNELKSLFDSLIIQKDIK